jgi:hypothetical protein
VLRQRLSASAEANSATKSASGAFDECCHCQQSHLLQIFESGSCQGFFATADAAAAAKALADTPRADIGL